MTLEQFREATQIMFDGFGTFQADRKCKAYYQIFQAEQVKIIAKAAEYATRNLPSFPNPRGFLNVVNMMKAQEHVTDFSHCAVCLGNGHISAKDTSGASWTYRCSCANGARYRAYPEWSAESGKELFDEYRERIDKRIADCPY